MQLHRQLIVGMACCLPLSIAACGGSSNSSPDAGGAPPTGAHYGYVVSQATVPTMSQVLQFGLDLGGPTSSKPDGAVDNKLGNAIAVIAGIGQLPIQSTINDAVNSGQLNLLADLQTPDFNSAASAGLNIKLGTMPVPAACTNPADLTTCGKQLMGNASFSIASDSPNNPPVTGPIVNGTFNAGPGSLVLQIALGSATMPITLSLVNARVKATGISETGMTAILAGVVTVADLNNNVLPAVQGQVESILIRDCGAVAQRTGPTCSCLANSTGNTVLFSIFMKTAPNCDVSVSDIQNNSTIKALLQPDVCTTATCTGDPDGLSIGVQVKTVKATFPM